MTAEEAKQAFPPMRQSLEKSMRNLTFAGLAAICICGPSPVLAVQELQ
jgi:hypothetical protein